MKRVLVLEKEWCEQEILCRMIRNAAGKAVVIRCETIEDAKRAVNEMGIDLFIISLGMENGMSGLYFIKQIREQNDYFYVPVLFISNQPKYELYAYRHLHCYEYIKRPYDREYVTQLLSEILCFHSNYLSEPQMIFSFRGVVHRFPIKEVIYVESLYRKLYVYTIYGVVEFPGMILKKFMSYTDSDFLIQCHRSFVVNYHYIRKYDKNESQLTMIRTAAVIPVGKTYRDSILARIKER